MSIMTVILFLNTDQLDLCRMVTTDEVVRADLLQFRPFSLAEIGGVLAARVEVAAAGRIGRVRDLALKDDAL